MPSRSASLALAACLAASTLSAACGPGTPPSPGPGDSGGSTGGGNTGGGSGGSGGSGGGDAGGGSTPSGGGDQGGGSTPPAAGDQGGGTTPSGGGSTPSGGAGDGGGSVATAWTLLTGGAGDEWVQDVAAAPGGAVVALTVVGPGSGGRFDQLGLVRLDASGHQELGRLYDLGAPVRFATDGALSVGPGGEVYVALSAQCGKGCGGLGGPVNGSALVQLSPAGEPRWRAPLGGEVASQPAVDASGNVAVASASGAATVVRSFAPSGQLRWEASLPGASSEVALAADGGGNVIVGRANEVAKLAPTGAVAWARNVPGTVAGVAGTGPGAVVVALSTPTGARVQVLAPDGGDQASHPLPGGDRVLVEVGTGRRIGTVTGAPGCGAAVTALDLDGSARWSRAVATSCAGDALGLNAVTVTTSGVVVIGGAARGPVDLGSGRLDPQRTDGIVAAFGP